MTLPTRDADDLAGQSFVASDVKQLGGVRMHGDMDYGGTDPSLGRRSTDAWLSVAGAADVGPPNGLPVDEWGIQVEECGPRAPVDVHSAEQVVGLLFPARRLDPAVPCV